MKKIYKTFATAAPEVLAELILRATTISEQILRGDLVQRAFGALFHLPKLKEATVQEMFAIHLLRLAPFLAHGGAVFHQDYDAVGFLVECPEPVLGLHRIPIHQVVCTCRDSNSGIGIRVARWLS